MYDDMSPPKHQSEDKEEGNIENRKTFSWQNHQMTHPTQQNYTIDLTIE